MLLSLLKKFGMYTSCLGQDEKNTDLSFLLNVLNLIKFSSLLFFIIQNEWEITYCCSIIQLNFSNVVLGAPGP